MNACPSQRGVHELEPDQARIHLVELQARIAGLRQAIEQVDAAHARKRRALCIVAGVAMMFGSGRVFVVAAPPPGGMKVKAPFVVVDRAGAQIVRVYVKDDGRALLNLSNSRGEYVAAVGASDKESYFYASTPDQSVRATMGVDGEVAYFKLGTGTLIAAQSVLDTAVNDQVSLDLKDGKPFVRLKAVTGHGVLQLSQGATGGGELEIARPDGIVVVRADISPGGLGRVEALPLGNPMGSALLGKPPQ